MANKEKWMKPNIGLSDQDRNNISKILNTLLSDEYLLYTKTRNYHWNVRGRQFNDLHKFFQAQYEELDAIADEVAERNRMLGGMTIGTMLEFTQSTRLAEQPNDYPDSWTMVGNLLADHESVIRCLRKDLEDCQEKYNDAGTADFLTGLMEQHEKMAWMLREFLEANQDISGPSVAQTKEKVGAK
jgi:starvation-inducible DNA-binding protein